MLRMRSKHMRGTVAALAVSMAFVFSGCSIHPTPFGYEFSESDYTLAIIQRVRCEIRNALVDQAAILLENDYPKTSDPDVKESFSAIRNSGPDFTAGSREVAEKLRTNPGYVRTIFSWDVNPVALVRAAPILLSSLGLKFDLNTKEENRYGLTPQLNPSAGPHVVTIGFGEHYSMFTRQNNRSIVESSPSISSYQNIPCKDDIISNDVDENHISKKNESDASAPTSQEELKLKDWKYPTRGNIGLDNTINSYVRFLLLDTKPAYLNEMAQNSLKESVLEKTGTNEGNINEFFYYLKNKDRTRCEDNGPTICELKCFENIIGSAYSKYISRFYDVYSNKASANAMSETLKFTTTISGGISPSIIFNGGGAFHLKSLSGGLSGNRTDEHTITIALKSPEIATPKKRFTEKVIGFNKNASLILKFDNNEENEVPLDEFCKSALNVLDDGKSDTPQQNTFGNAGNLFVEPRLSDDEKNRKIRELQSIISNSEQKILSDQLQQLVDQ